MSDKVIFWQKTSILTNFNYYKIKNLLPIFHKRRKFSQLEFQGGFDFKQYNFWKRSKGEVQGEKNKRRRSRGEGQTEKVQGRRSNGEGTRKVEKVKGRTQEVKVKGKRSNEEGQGEKV